MRLWAVAAAGALAVIFGVTALGSSGPDPKTLVLRVSDLPLPSQYKTDFAKHRTNAELGRDISEPATMLKLLGRVNGYWVDFGLRPYAAGAKPKGPNAVDSAVGVYVSAAKAHASFVNTPLIPHVPLDFLSQTGEGNGTLLPLKPVIGAESRILKFPPGKGGALGEFLVVWRSGRLLGAVSAWGDKTPTSAIALAEKQQARMQQVS